MEKKLKKNKVQRGSTKGKINYKVGYLAIWFAALSTYTFQDRGSCKETITTDFPSMFGLSPFSSNEGSANSATKSART